MLAAAPPPRYTVQILLPYQPQIDPDIIHRQLVAWREDVQLIGPHYSSSPGHHFGFAIPTHDLPLLAHVFQAAPEA